MRNLYFIFRLVFIFLFIYMVPATAYSMNFGFKKSYALVVGIDSYKSNSWIPLNYAVSDANHVATFLKTQGFNTTLLINENATRAAIISFFSTLSKIISNNDRFIFFFGGHGHTEKVNGEEVGYLIPYLFSDDSSEYLSLQELKNQAKRISQSKHQLFILNSCYGGLIGILRGGALDPKNKDYLSQITSRPARQFISAGGANQRVVDGGPEGMSWFTYYFLEALNGSADLVKDNIITFSELSSYLVPRASNEYQTPAWGALYGHGLGEFVFAVDAKSSVFNKKISSIEENTLRGINTVDISNIRKPIDNLYLAWENLDIQLYLAQWSSNAVQYLPNVTRYFDHKDCSKSIICKRKKDFNKFKRVEVVDYQIYYVRKEDDLHILDASYTMNFYLNSGRTIKEHGIRERYKVIYVEADNKWKIVENSDYLK